MAYKVRLTRPAEDDAYAAYDYIREVAPKSCDKWLEELFATIGSLGDLPARCPLIPEAEELGYPARQLLYGKRTGTYRIIFDIQDESEEGPRVRVLRIRHASRDAITAEAIQTALYSLE
jgi:plasmid stabilization system protein ParE